MADRRLATGVFLSFLCVLGSVVCQDPTVTMPQSSPVLARRGSNLTLSCQVNEGLKIFLTHAVSWLKKSRVPGLTNETLTISSQQVLQADPARYNVTVEPARDSLVVRLQVRNVEDGDDGRYICKLATLQQSEVARGETDVIVPNLAAKLTLTVNERSAEARVKVTPGSHSVQCLAEGSNPESEELNLEVGGRPLSDNLVKNSSFMPVASVAAGAPRYRVHVEGQMHVQQADNGSALRCTAVNAQTDISTSLHVVPQPSVHCDDARVLRSDKRVQLVCTVTHAQVEIVDYEWELSDSGAVYSTEGPAHNNTFRTEKVSETQTRVSLPLDVVRWGGDSTAFKLTALTEVGSVSHGAHLLVNDEDDEDDDDDHGHDHDDDDHGNGEDGGEDRNGTPASQPVLKMFWHQAVLSLVMMLLLCRV